LFEYAIEHREDLSDQQLAAVYSALGLAYMEHGYGSSAIPYFDKAISLSPGNPEFLNNRGRVRAEPRGDSLAAITDLTEAIKLKPDYAEAYANRAVAYLRARQIETRPVQDHFKRRAELSKLALRDCDEAVRLGPNLALSFYNRAYCHRYSEERSPGFPQIVGELDRAISLKPDYAEAVYMRGKLTNDNDLYKVAIADWSRAIERDPRDGLAYEHRAFALAGSRQLDAAVRDYDQAIRLLPNEIDLFRARGHVKFVRGDFKSAAEDFARYVEHAENFRPKAMALLWKHVALRRAGVANSLGTEIKSANKAPTSRSGKTICTSCPKRLWPPVLRNPAIDLFLGTQTPEQVQAEIDRITKLRYNSNWPSQRVAYELCEMYFFLGEHALLAGNVQFAKDKFQAAVNLGNAAMEVHRAAANELARLN
jgi:tetratricopeptide (TPR) repeat protein